MSSRGQGLFFAAWLLATVCWADVPVDVSVRPGHGTWNRGNVMVAASDAGYLLSWTEWRRPSCVESDLYSNSALPFQDWYALRLSPSLSLLDPVAWPLRTAPSTESGLGMFSRATYHPDGYALAGCLKGTFEFTVVGDGGVTLMAQPFGAAEACDQPALAWNGSEYLATWWHNAGGNYFVRACRFGVDGRVLGAPFTLNPTHTATEQAPAVFAIDGGWLLPYLESTSRLPVRLAVLDPDGGPVRFTTPLDDDEPSAAAFYDVNPSALLIARSRGDAGAIPHFRRVGFDGFPLDTSDQFTAIGTGLTDLVGVAAEPSQFWLATSNFTGVYGARVSNAGVVLDVGGRVLLSAPSGLLDADIAARPGGAIVAALRGPPHDVVVQRLTTAGALLNGTAGLTLSVSNNAQTQPRLIEPGLLVWTDEYPTGESKLRMALVASDGGVGAAAWVSPSVTGAQSDCAGAFDGTNYLLAWTATGSNTTVQATRVSGAGTTLDTPVQLGGSRRHRPTVVFSAGQFLAAWADSLQGAVELRSVSTSLALGPVTTLVPPGSDSRTAVHLAVGTQAVLATWAEDVFLARAISASRLTLNGTVLAGGPFRVSDDTSADPLMPVSFPRGDGFQTMWTHISGYGRRIRSASVDADAGVSAHDYESLSGSTFFGAVARPAVAVSGAVTLGVWETDEVNPSALQLEGKLWYADGGTTPVFALGEGAWPSVLLTDAGVGLLAFERFDPTLLVPRVYVRAVSIAELEALAFLDAGVLDAGALDAGVLDAGVLDAGALDAGALDAGALDAGALDAGALDAGALDAGALDAGVLDAGVLDAGVLDAGVLDAGVLDAGDLDAGGLDGGDLDAGDLDAGDLDALDAGTLSTQPRHYTVGCGCESMSGTMLTGVLLLLARRWRRSSTARNDSR